MKEVPIWEKSNLTLEEAAAYSGIGINKLRSISDSEKCQFVLWIGSKRLIKRKKLDEYTSRLFFGIPPFLTQREIYPCVLFLVWLPLILAPFCFTEKSLVPHAS